MRLQEILLENPKSQANLEALANAILDMMAKQVVSKIAGYRSYYGRLDDMTFSHLDVGVNTWLNLDPKALPGSIRRFARRRHGIHVTLGGESSYDDNRIKIIVPRGFLQTVLEHPDDVAMIRGLLRHSLPSLVHELSHAYDDARSKGRYVRNKRSTDTRTKLAAYERDPSDDNEAAWSAAYAVDPAETNAWFQAAVTASKHALHEPFEDYARIFMDHFPHYRQLPKLERQRLLKRLFVQWDQ
jgi:hypothetical protein